MFLNYEDVEMRHKRTQTFFKFLFYDWGEDDEDEQDNNDNQTNQKDQKKETKKEVVKGTKEWEIYKDVNFYETKDKFAKQALKRDFYNKHVDKEFNSIVNNDLDDEGMKKFNKYCHFYNCLGIVGFDQ